MTKTTVAAPILGAMSLCLPFLVYSRNKNAIKRQFIISIVLSLTLSLLLYLVFIKATAENKGTYSDFKIDLVDYLFGIGTKSIYLDILILVTMKFVFLRLFFGNLRSTPFLQFLTLLALVSLTMSLLIRFSLSVANTFVATVFLLVSSLLLPLTIKKEIENRRRKQVLGGAAVPVASVIGFSSGFFATSCLQYLNYIFQLRANLLFFASIIPLFAVLLVTLIVLGKYSERHMHYVFLSALIVLGSSMTGSYVAQSLRSAQQEFEYNRRKWDLPLEDTQFTLKKFDGATRYLRNNLNFYDLIASNSAADKGLLAALTGIRNYGSSYFPNQWGGEENRYVEQDIFAKDLSENSYLVLRDGCVTWFYFDKEDTPGKSKSFEPYATTLYEDEYGAVLKLSESYPVPDECLK